MQKEKSKTQSIISKVPRSYIILLKVLEEIFSEENVSGISESRLIQEYNRRSIKLMIGKIQLNEMRDIIQTLCTFDILFIENIKGKKNDKLIRLKEDLTELQKALENDDL